jgi:hypothetical protein
VLTILWVKEKNTPSNNTHTNRNEDAGSPPIEATGRTIPTHQRSIQGLSAQSRITPTSSASSPSQKSYISQNTKKSTQSNIENKAPDMETIDSSVSDKPIPRIGAYRRFNLHKVRVFQQARNRGYSSSPVHIFAPTSKDKDDTILPWTVRICKSHKSIKHRRRDESNYPLEAPSLSRPPSHSLH